MRRGGDVCFLVSDSESAVVVEERGYDTHCLATAQWDHLETELTELTGWIDVERAGLLLVDSYYVTRRYMEALYQKLTLIYLGKFQEEAFPAHIVIDYTISVMEDAGAYQRYDQIGAGKLLGCRYFPLRREFTENMDDAGKFSAWEGIQAQASDRRIPGERPQKMERKACLDVLILTGGSDPFHIAWKLSCRLAGRYRLHVVAGTFCADLESLKELAGRHPDTVMVYQNVRKMSDLMRRCDLAVSAGGITLYELCACGLPTVAYTFADNQRAAVEVFAKRKIMLSAGDIRDRGEEQWISRMKGCIEALAVQKEEREAMRERMLRLVDGGGTGRIVDAIAGYVVPKLYK